MPAPPGRATYKQDRVLGDWVSGLSGVLLVVQSEATHRPDVLEGQGGEEEPDVGHVVRHFVLPEDVPYHDAGLLGLANVRGAFREDGIAVVYTAILGEKTDEALQRSANSG